MERTDFEDQRLLKALSESKIIALPTETVYGLGVLWDDAEAYERLVHAKNRRPDKAISCMVSDDFDFDQYFVLTPAIRRVMKAFLPGPLTILVKAKDTCPFQSHLGTGICGIRIPAKDDLLAFLRKVRKPLQVTSANLSGQKALYESDSVYQLFKDNDDIPYLVEGTCQSAIPTTVVDLTKDEPVLIRSGEITLDSIKEIYHGKR